MLGFLLSHADHYHGFDVASDTQQGVREMYEDLNPLADGKHEAELLLCPFEQAKLQRIYDFASTSPPYFDVERYEGGAQSHQTFPTFDRWVEGFYKPMMHNVAAGLKPGAVFALNVSSHRYPLTMTAINLASDAGFDYVENRRTARMVAATEDDDDGSVICIFRKR